MGPTVIARPVIGYELGRRSHRAKNKGVDLRLAKALDDLQAGAPRYAAVDFDRPGDQHLANPTATRGDDDRVILGTEWDDRFICLDNAAQRLAIRVDHGAAQLGAQHPGGSVRAEAKLALQLQSRNAVGVRGHQKGRPEPGGQRQLAGMHDRAGGHRGLPAAGGTFIGEWFGLQTPGAAAAASGADKPVRPAALEEVFCARRLRRKTTLELDQRFWKSALRSGHGPHLLNPLNRSGVYANVHFLYT